MMMTMTITTQALKDMVKGLGDVAPGEFPVRVQTKPEFVFQDIEFPPEVYSARGRLVSITQATWEGERVWKVRVWLDMTQLYYLDERMMVRQ